MCACVCARARVCVVCVCVCPFCHPVDPQQARVVATYIAPIVLFAYLLAIELCLFDVDCLCCFVVVCRGL